MHLPFPADGPAAGEADQFALRLRDEPEIIQRELGVFLVAKFLVPEFQARPAKTETGDGEMPSRRTGM